MLATTPWAHPRPRFDSIARLGVPYLALAVAVRLSVGVHSMLTMDWGALGDTSFYYDMVALSDHGLYPFIHFWTEYPPVFPILVTGLYRVLALCGLGTPDQFSSALTGMLWGIDLANLGLVYYLVRQANGERAARWAAAIYAGCPALVFVSSGWFDPLAVLFFLAGLYALTRKHAATAGVLIALGILTKVFPGVLLLAAPIALGWRGTGRLLIAMTAVLGGVLVPLLVIRPDLLLASLASMATRGPWETLPAILSGYYGWGTQPALQDRFSAATAVVGSGVPALLTVVPEGVLLLAVAAAWRSARHGTGHVRDVYLVAALGVTTFVLGNKGFSPQFVAWLIPVVLLAWPTTVGLLYVGLLTAHSLLYAHVVFPVMWSYYTEHAGSTERLALTVSASVILRTALIAAIALHLYWQSRRSAVVHSPWSVRHAA